MISRHAHAKRDAGFTLVEIVVTVLIMGLMLTGITRLLTAVRTSSRNLPASVPSSISRINVE